MNKLKQALLDKGVIMAIKRLIIIILMLFTLSSCATISALPINTNGPKTMTETETDKLVDAVMWDTFLFILW